MATPADADKGFTKMDAEIPKTGTPTDASAPSEQAAKPTPAAPELPKLSPQEFRIYNRMAEHMDLFHNNFRSTWNVLYKACETGKRPSGMSMRQFLATGDDFVHHLTVHHGIEEQYIFPVLAKRMPAFKKELELLGQHKEIHKGLDRLEEWLGKCRNGEIEVRMGDMKEIMDGFGTVLWRHLDDEVHELRAENMRKYWSKEEMPRLPM